MSLLFETISIREGRPENLRWHRQRVDASAKAAFGRVPSFRLEEEIVAPPTAASGHYRCRVDYDTEIREITFRPYVFNAISSLKPVEDNTISYNLKYADRTALLNIYAQRGSCDDVLIVKDGLITDSSYANVALLKNGQWFTPSAPLLPGTCRARLIHENMLIPVPVRVDDLHHYESILLINALRGFRPETAFPVSGVRF